jgi:hypothetical protein
MSFVFGGGGVSLRAAGNHPIEKSILPEKVSNIVKSSSVWPLTVI